MCVACSLCEYLRTKDEEGAQAERKLRDGDSDAFVAELSHPFRPLNFYVCSSTRSFLFTEKYVTRRYLQKLFRDRVIS
jgi:hypothetical protein